MQQPLPPAREPYLLDLGHRGFIEGVTIRDAASSRPLCRYFGGLPYALPPQRWRMPRPLPPCYQYGTRAAPGRFAGGAGICPQSAAHAHALGDEDCLQLNVWVPMGAAPKGGWPVFFFIHGGFLQVGSANDLHPEALLSETAVRAVIVAPAYRLNVFGFLASRELKAASAGEPVGNLGFWDQRAALEWTRNTVSYFGGDAGNITVGGYSAGSHSAFKQLAYDAYLPRSKAIIKRVIMWSNGPGVAPKSLQEAQEQFDTLLARLHIPPDLPGAQKVARLARTPAPRLLAAARSTPMHQFRAVADGVFAPHALYPDIDSGAFGARLRARGIRILAGECANEHFVYGRWYPPATDTLGALAARLEVDYPAAACDALIRHYSPTGALPPPATDWRDAFGRVYADVQIHALLRGFADKLWRDGEAPVLLRYRVDFVTRSARAMFPPGWGATHTTDLALWFLGNGVRGGLAEREKQVARGALLDPLARFLRGEVDVGWGAVGGPREVRRLREDGEVEVWLDEDWEKGVAVWEALEGVGATGEGEAEEEGLSVSRGAKL
ncbi:uncharacterized protein K452DRAFT_276868 [Aplosporella prunicola CBS 121167]|uniref:Carboxylic ester hydrolase n=1 Tax=Aplosporella prunicola CBS 121167 TaxID=1176127 RepID=A0A6A6B2M9_9PEZI|nr:uncharacterized protein K452DRAFT_276868 [Aplosporella prunicola CBS 121167]KAF2138462.1 hypothetical protein K452DRAFT_276868 [Aplosporella prunicola CBS 121167]